MGKGCSLDGKDVGLFAEVDAGVVAKGASHLVGAFFDSDDSFGAAIEGAGSEAASG